MRILDHPFIISVVLHGFDAYPRDKEKEESPQEKMNYGSSEVFHIVSLSYKAAYRICTKSGALQMDSRGKTVSRHERQNIRPFFRLIKIVRLAPAGALFAF